MDSAHRPCEVSDVDVLPDAGDPPTYERPRTRAECAGGPRPCPYVSCRHHLYLDVSARTGHIKLSFPDLEVWEMAESCTLDVADRGGVTLEVVGEIMGLTRERIRQMEVQAKSHLKHEVLEPARPRRLSLLNK